MYVLTTCTAGCGDDMTMCLHLHTLCCKAHERALKKAESFSNNLPRKRSTRLLAKEVQRAEDEQRDKERAEQERIERAAREAELKRIAEERKALQREERRLQRLKQQTEQQEARVCCKPQYVISKAAG
jgi:hypothetical protein